MTRRMRRRGSRGQAMPLVGLVLAVVTGFVALGVDLGHQFAQKLIGQSAVDSAAISAAYQLEHNPLHLVSGVLLGVPLWNDPSVAAAHDYVAADGFATAWPAELEAACLPASHNSTSQFSEEFFDASYTGPCTATPSSFATEVVVNVPPLTYGSSSLPNSCNPNLHPPGYPDNCIQVVVVQRVSNFIMQVFGAASEELTTVATGFASPVVGVNLPSAVAVQLYEQTSCEAAVGNSPCVLPATGACSPGAGSPAAFQCFNEDHPPQKTTPSCSGSSDNCPTFFAETNANVQIEGADGTLVAPGAAHIPAVSSAGDIVDQSSSVTMCDAFNFVSGSPAGKCTPGQPRSGDQSFMLAPSAALYCNAISTNPNTGNTPPTPPPVVPSSGLGQSCTQTGVGTSSPPAYSNTNVGTVYGNPTAYVAPTTWTPVAPVAPTDDCGGLILNGDPITAANNPPVFFNWDGKQGDAPTAMATVPSACVPPTATQYTIEPGLYSFIVINFGQYDFENGFYEISGNAPVNTITTVSGSREPNGIDHSQELASTDWDLCPNSGPGDDVTSCSALTAGIWIGHGDDKWGYGSGTSSSGTNTCGSGSSATIGGGGKDTEVTGVATSFRFDSTSNGFVATNETKQVEIGGPAIGTMPQVSGVPMLFDVENPSGFVHLDGQNGETQFTGLLYEASSGTQGRGGVDIQPGLGPAGSKATLDGQVIAYSLVLFGNQQGLAVDFSSYWGTGTPGPAGAGSDEPSLVTIPVLSFQAGSAPGTEVLHLQYNDETEMDAYDLSVTINYQTYYFSAGLWTLSPPNSSASPPNPWPPQSGYTPSDACAMYAFADQVLSKSSPYPSTLTPYSAGTYVNGTAYYDAMTLPSSYAAGSNGYFDELVYDSDAGQPDNVSIDVSGDWTWGNQDNITLPSGSQVNNHPRTDRYSADIYVTLPIPAGATSQIVVHAADGDHGGDYSNTSATLTNITGGSGVASNVGAVELVQ